MPDNSNKKICIISDQHLCANPRVWKEASTLAQAGYDVSVITKSNSARDIERDQDLLKKLSSCIDYKYAYTVINSELSFFDKVKLKGIPKLAVLFKKVTGIDSKYLFASDPDTTAKVALSENADLYISHVECGLYVGRKLQQKGRNVAFDIEDWYSNDYLVASRPVKMLKQLERYAVNNGVYTSCTSIAMATALKNVYEAKEQPNVIYNSFQKERKIERVGNAMPKVVWFSQTVGEGRGLEKFIKALAKVTTPVSLLLVGNCSDEYNAKLQKIFPHHLGHVLEFNKPVSHDQLHGLLSQCDIGLAIENNHPENKDKTISNKLFQYYQAGIKVFATDTTGQKEIAKDFSDVTAVVPAEEIESWSEEFEELLRSSDNRDSVVERFNEKYVWETQGEKLLKLVKNALAT